jgi:hypothetical protein
MNDDYLHARHLRTPRQALKLQVAGYAAAVELAKVKAGNFP